MSRHKWTPEQERVFAKHIAAVARSCKHDPPGAVAVQLAATHAAIRECMTFAESESFLKAGARIMEPAVAHALSPDDAVAEIASHYRIGEEN